MYATVLNILLIIPSKKSVLGHTNSQIFVAVIQMARATPLAHWRTMC